MADEQRPLTIAQAQQLCGVSRRTIYNWIARGRVTVLRTPGGHPRLWSNELLRVQPPPALEEASEA